jgi:hypothetical protein
MSDAVKTKKSLILEAARAIGAQKFTPAEIEQLRRRLVADHGEEDKAGSDYIAEVLTGAGMGVILSR